MLQSFRGTQDTGANSTGLLQGELQQHSPKIAAKGAASVGARRQLQAQKATQCSAF